MSYPLCSCTTVGPLPPMRRAPTIQQGKLHCTCHGRMHSSGQPGADDSIVIACFSAMPCGVIDKQKTAEAEKQVLIACFSVMPCGSPTFGTLARKDLGGVKR